MRRPLILLAAGLVLIVLFGAWLLRGSGDERVAIAFLDDVAGAAEMHEVYRVDTVELQGQSRRALLPGDFRRATWALTVPNRAWLRVSLGMLPEASEIEGDGVLFIIGAWDEVTWDDLLSLVVNPYGNPDDRGWHDIAIDLSKHAGQHIQLRFIIRSRDSTAGDLPAWGEPRIEIR